jgi:hypothetical protein
MPNLPKPFSDDKTPRVIQIAFPTDVNDEAMIEHHGAIWIVTSMDEHGDVDARSIATGRNYFWLKREYREVEDNEA